MSPVTRASSSPARRSSSLPPTRRMTARSKPPPSRSAATASRRPCECGEPRAAMSCACRPVVTARRHFFRRNNMGRTTRRLLAGAGLVAVLAVSSALAQQPQTVRLRGPIAAVDGSTLTVKAGEAGDVKVKLTDNAAVYGVVKASLADIKPGAFIGVGATPQADGSQRAIQVVIFAEVQRGTGEGHRPWDRPNTTMTNATVDTTVAGVDGQAVTVKYKDGEKKIIVGPDAVIRAYVVGSRDELKPGANINIIAATKKPDGTFEAARVNVGRDGIVP